MPTDPTDEFAEPVEWHNRFDVGVTEFHPGPDSHEIHDMLYLVAYDIADPKRLRKVARACEDFGIRVEKSVFECDLPESDFEQLWLTIIDLVEEDEDAVIAYRICKSCLRQTESMGAVVRPEKPLCYIL